MNTLDDLRSRLDTYADRGDGRGADAVWKAASTRSLADPEATTTTTTTTRRPLLVALAAAAACVLVVATIAALRINDDVGVVTTPPPDPAAPSSLVPIEVVGGQVQAVAVAFDRIWVATIDADRSESNTRVRSFDIASGSPLTDTEVRGMASAIVTTDASVWVQTSLGWDSGPDDAAGERSLALVNEIDPTNGALTSELALQGRGPMAAHGSRLAVADDANLTILDDATGSEAQIPIRDAVGHDNVEDTANGRVAFGFHGLALGSDGLFGTYETSNELVQMDPATGAHIATQLIEDGAEGFGPNVAAADGYLWSPGATTVYGVQTPFATPPNRTAERRVVVGGSVSEIAPLDDGRFVAVLATQAVVAGDPGREDLRTALDPAATSAVITLDGVAWVAQWHLFDEDASTTVAFVRLRTDASMPGGAPPATTPPAVLLMKPEPLEDGETVAVGGAGLPAGARVVLAVCLVDEAAPEPCPLDGEPDPASIATVGDLAGFGELLTEWTAQRHIDDGRPHDCGVEACELRVYGVSDDGRVDTDTVLARRPLDFAG